MKKFMIAPSAAFEATMVQAMPERQQKGMQDWMTWMQVNKTSLVDHGGPLGKTKRIDTGGTHDARNDVGGYSTGGVAPPHPEERPMAASRRMGRSMLVFQLWHAQP